MPTLTYRWRHLYIDLKNIEKLDCRNRLQERSDIFFAHTGGSCGKKISTMERNEGTTMVMARETLGEKIEDAPSVLVMEEPGLLNRALDFPLDQEVVESLDEMRRDPATPLNNCVIQFLLKTPERANQFATILLSCLANDTWSRRTLREALRFASAPPSHPAFALLEQVEREDDAPPRRNPDGSVYSAEKALAALARLRDPANQVTEEQWQAFKHGIDESRPGQRAIYKEGYNPTASEIEECKKERG